MGISQATGGNGIPDTHTKRGARGGNAQAPLRTLRRKPDSTETQMKQYNLNPLKDHMEYISESFQTKEGGSLFNLKDYEDALSTREIMNAKLIFERCDMDGEESENF